MPPNDSCNSDYEFKSNYDDALVVLSEPSSLIDISSSTSSLSLPFDQNGENSIGTAFLNILANLPSNLTTLLTRNLNTILLEQLGPNTEFENLQTVQIYLNAQEISFHNLSERLPQLKSLNLTGSILDSIRDLGCNWGNLKVLNISNCKLHSLDGIMGFNGLIGLYAADNKIKEINLLYMLSQLEILDLKNTLISNVSSISFLSNCRKLQHILLDNCPITKTSNYRNQIKNAIASLTSLDDIPFEISVQAESSNKISVMEENIPSTSKDTSNISNLLENLDLESSFIENKLPSICDEKNRKMMRPYTCNGIIVPFKKIRKTRPFTSNFVKVKDYQKFSKLDSLFDSHETKNNPNSDALNKNVFPKFENTLLLHNEKKKMTTEELLKATKEWREKSFQIRSENKYFVF